MEFLVRWFPWTGRTMPYAGVQFGSMNGRVHRYGAVGAPDDEVDGWGTQYGGGCGVQHWFTDQLGGYAEAMLAGVPADGLDFGFWRLTAGAAVRF